MTNPAPVNSPILPPGPVTGTIDITDLVEKLRSAFVKWGTEFIIDALSGIPWLLWLQFPVIKQLFRFFLERLLEVLSHALEMQAFFLNTAIGKSLQAKSFVDAVDARSKLPLNANAADIEIAEIRQMQAFRNFVRLKN